MVGFLAQYLWGDRLALRAASAIHVTEQDRPDLIERVDRLAQIAGMPRPRVAISKRLQTPTAFAVGTRPATATILLTSSLLETLDDDELDAVIAHELAHVKNRDVAVMTVARFLPSVTYWLATTTYGLLTGMVYSLPRSRRYSGGNGGKGFFMTVLVSVVTAISTLAISVVFWLLSTTLYRVLAQYREFAADRGAAAITGDPGALASALRTLDDEMASLPDEDLREADGGSEALYVVPIDDHQFGEEHELISSDILPATHPPTEERIERLRELQGATS